MTILYRVTDEIINMEKEKLNPSILPNILRRPINVSTK